MKDNFDSLFELDRSSKKEHIDVDVNSSVNINSKTKKKICVDTSSSKGSNNYNSLENKPSIEGITLIGDKTFEELNFTINLIDCGTSTTVI